VTVVSKSGKVDPEAGAQFPGVAPGIAGGVDHLTTAPVWLVAVTFWFEGTRVEPVKLAPVRLAPAIVADTAPKIKLSTKTSLVRFAPLRFAPSNSVPAVEMSFSIPSWSTPLSAKRVAPDRSAWVKLALVTSAALQLADGSPGSLQLANLDPAKLAYERFSPLKSAPARLEPAQLVKWVGVGFETTVQPSVTVSAEAGVVDAVTKTGVTSAAAMARAEPPTRRSRPTIMATPDLAALDVTTGPAVLPANMQ
jgi:hypothetical protein